jgi:hypothetical protein
MNKIEKILFLHIRQYQYSVSEESEINAVYREMTEEEKNEYAKLWNELHEIWNYINSPPVLNVRADDGVKTVQAYHEKVNPVNDVILKVINDFDFTLKETMTKKQKAAMIAILGESYFNEKYRDVQIIDDLE